MDNSQAQLALQILRSNLENSATPNMERAITNKAYIAALVYALAYIDAMAGFYYGMDAKAQVKKLKKKGDGVDIRYTKFVEKYLSPAQSGCNYMQLDLYASLRCNMLHSLMSGHVQKGKYHFILDHDVAHIHGTIDGSKVTFDVPTFCSDVLSAVKTFLGDVEQSFSQTHEPPTLKNFKYWWDNGYSILVSATRPEQLPKEASLKSFVHKLLGFFRLKGAG